MKLNVISPYIIAEIGQAHEGSLGLAYSYVDALAGTGVDAVKFQMHIAEAESSIFEPFRVHFSKEDKSRFDYWLRMGFRIDQWRDLKSYTESKGMDFICSPFSLQAVDWLEEMGIQQYKIGSGEVNNLLMLEKIAATGKPIILSSGMSSLNELDNTVAFLRERGASFSILQCTTSYPTSPEAYGLNVIGQLRERYQVKTGYSDHSARIETCIAATALGAEILEFHVVFDRQMFGPDAMSSLTIAETAQLVSAVRNIRVAMENPVDKSDNSGFSQLKTIFEKSLSVNKDIQAGHILTLNDLEAKKPKGQGIEAALFRDILGKPAKRDLRKWDFLTTDDI